jgi:N6-adenosine-specific RNA methylase IME4
MKKYKTILADPPWPVRGGKNGKGGWSKKVSPHVHYPLMKTKDIMALPVRELAYDDSHLYLWVVNGLLQEGLDTGRAWGFRYVNNVCWGKTSGYGLGQYWRGEHELCLFFVRGKIPYARDPITKKRKQSRSLILADRGEHSEKPGEIHNRIEVVSPGPYLEMFARKKGRDGWDYWGNEIKSDIEIISPSQDQKAVV